MNNDLVIIGSGGFAREVAWLVEECNRQQQKWNLLGFVEADPGLVGQVRGKYRILGDEDSYLMTATRTLHVAIGIGTPSIVSRVADKLKRNESLVFPNLVHPSVMCDRDRISFGRGNIICAGNVLTTDIGIGDFNILNLSSTFGHDVVIGNCNVINPGCNISGNVKIGDRCLIGTGSVILEKHSVGDDAIVGAGAVVTRDVPPTTTVVGIPARPLLSKEASCP